MRVQRRRGPAGLDRAKSAASRTCVAHQHDCGCSGGFVRATPAIVDIGASGFFAHSVEVETSEVGFDAFVIRRSGYRRLEPGGKAGDLTFSVGGADKGGAEGWFGVWAIG